MSIWRYSKRISYLVSNFMDFQIFFLKFLRKSESCGIKIEVTKSIYREDYKYDYFTCLENNTQIRRIINIVSNFIAMTLGFSVKFDHVTCFYIWEHAHLENNTHIRRISYLVSNFIASTLRFFFSIILENL